MEITVNFFIDMLKAAKPIAVSKLIALGMQHGLNAQQAINLCNNFEIQLHNDMLDMSEFPLPPIGTEIERKWFESILEAHPNCNLQISSKGKGNCTTFEIEVEGRKMTLLFFANQCQGFLQASHSINEIIEQLKGSAV